LQLRAIALEGKSVIRNVVYRSPSFRTVASTHGGFGVSRSCGLLPVILIVNLLAFSAVHAGATGNPAAELQSQVCPMLDDLTEASISMATQDRTSASTQIESIIGLLGGLSSTVQSPQMINALGKSGKPLQRALLRFHSRLTKAKSLLDNPTVADSTAFRAMLAAISEGQRLRQTLLEVPAPDTVVTVRETGVRDVALSYPGDVVCFHVNVRNDTAPPSCGEADVSVAVLHGDPTNAVIEGSPSFQGPADFCLTMGPDAGTVRVSITMCGQANGVLLYNYGTPKGAGKGKPVPQAPSNLAITVVTPTSATLNWQDNSDDEAGFQIERAPSAGGPWALVGTVESNVTTLTDNGLAPATSYYYRVFAFN
jgi:hypothetical protein